MITWEMIRDAVAERDAAARLIAERAAVGAIIDPICTQVYVEARDLVNRLRVERQAELDTESR